MYKVSEAECFGFLGNSVTIMTEAERPEAEGDM
jgi:hypothetical protein